MLAREPLSALRGALAPMPWSNTRRWLCLALCCALLALSAPAHADGVADEAEINFRLGAERYQAGDYRAALAFFLASQRLAPNHNVRFNVVRTFQRLGMHAEAYRWCQEALRDETDAAQRAELAQLLTAIEREVAVLDVASQPAGATIYVDRVDLGSVATTPARLALAPGEHKLILELPGYERAELTGVRVERQKTVSVSQQLTRIVGTLELAAERATEVRVDSEDGELACLTPCTLALPPGPHTLHFRRAGYWLSTHTLRVEAGRRLRVYAEAVPRTGSIVVTSDVRGAAVEVDGQVLGFTPAVLHDVPVGARRVRLSLAGYEPLTRELEVQEGRTASLRELSLVPARQVTAASRVSESVDDAPASVSVVTPQELEAFRYPTIAEALRGQRGVALGSDGVYTGLTLRGLGQPGDYGNRVLILADGTPLNDNILWQSYVGYDGRADLGDVERIEVVRGPGSVLYGTGALTGLVNLVPKALPERPTTELRIQASETRTARARAAYAMPLGARSGFSLSLAGAHSDGRELKLPTTPPTSVDHVERFDAVTGQARAKWRDLSLTGFVTFREQDIPAGAYGALVGDPRNWVRDTRGLLEARFEPELVARKLHLYTRAYANLYRFDSEQAFPPDLEAGPSSESLVDERYRGTWFGGEARVVGTLSERVRLTGGGEIQASTRASLYGASTADGVRTVPLNDDLPYQIYAGYLLGDIKLTRQLALSAGARVDAWSTFGATVNPRLNLVLRPSAHDVLKLVAGRAYRAPSVYELRYRDGRTQVRSDFDENELLPELAWSGELEFTHRFLEHWALVAALHFQYAEALMEQALTDPANERSPVYYRNDDSDALTAGGDLELRRELYRGLLFVGSYGYLYARYMGEAPMGSSRLPNAPAHYASFRLIVPVWQGTRLAVRSALEAPRRISDLTTEETRTGVITDLVFSGLLGDSGFDFAVGVYNLFDFRVALPTDPTFVTRTMPQLGRSLLVSLGLRL
jgi:outer membrane receptor for ferrienterochelin and colicins